MGSGGADISLFTRFELDTAGRQRIYLVGEGLPHSYVRLRGQ